jgi:hypothetical protein
MISERSQFLYQFTKRTVKLTVAIIVGYHCYHLISGLGMSNLEEAALCVMSTGICLLASVNVFQIFPAYLSSH